MPKYHLVASYYDIFEKNSSLRYKNEIEISLPGIDLSTLQAIDNFTASHSQIEIYKILEQQLGIAGRNQLSIKYQKNKTSNPIYYKVIKNNPEFVSCTQNNKLASYWIGNKNVRSLVVSRYTPLFEKELSNLLKIIENRNLEEFHQMYPYENSDLYFLVKRYIGTSFDTMEASQTDLDLIIKEFSRYKTFRGWIVAKEKTKDYQKGFTKFTTNVKPQPFSQKPIPVHSIEEHAAEYQRNFDNDSENKKNGITYESYQTYQYNTAHLEEDKEEFLEENEMDLISGTFAFFENEPSIKRKRR